MQISKVSDDGTGEGRAGGSTAEDQNPEYQTANELFELMTKNTYFECDTDSLSAQDLVLLYQNIDIGTRLMNDVPDFTPKKPNQYVETVVYNDHEDHGSDSDSEMYANADMHDVFSVNQERLDFLTDNSLENLCHKFGSIAMNNSDLYTDYKSFDYSKNFLFKDPYISNQLQNLKVIGSASKLESIFATSLIDFVSCKHLGDDCSFYMDSVIRYVQNTIEQLKRISNGDYLTDRAKKKWKEANARSTERINDTNILATSASIPIHVGRRTSGNVIWDDIVHSEIDVRTLTKILEKKIIVEIPKLICGSYRLYGKLCADNLIISCHREDEEGNKDKDTRVDVVLQLQRSQAGQAIRNISSVMILKTTPAFSDLRAVEPPALPSNEETVETMTRMGCTTITTTGCTKESEMTIIELVRGSEPVIVEHGIEQTIVEEILEEDVDDNGSCVDTNSYPFSDRYASYASMQYSSESSLAIKDSPEKQVFQSNDEEKLFQAISPRELQMTMQKLNMQNATVEENCDDTVSQSTSKRRSPIRVRIKSPYENKSLALEEKKRRRLLEIRERREKKKLALSENCKISKHKYGRSAIMPQASSSVTKLSITNKSFYNSIYGHSATAEIKTKLHRSQIINSEAQLPADESQDYFEAPKLSPDKNSRKYINRSYYLDDADTEVMYIQTKKSDDKSSAANSVVSNEYNDNFDIFKQLVDVSETHSISFTPDDRTSDSLELSVHKSLLPMAETNNITNSDAQKVTKESPSDDACRKSIDELYGLIKQFGRSNTPVEEISPNKLDISDVVESSFVINGSESGTSVKHLNAYSSKINVSSPKSNKTQLAGVPQVILSSKQSPKTEADKIKRERNRRAVISPPLKNRLTENPLKAISQLLHEIDSVQKNRQRPLSDTKPHKKVESGANDVKARQVSYRRKSRLDQHLKDDEQEKKTPPNITSPKDKRMRPMTPFELARAPQLPSPVEDRPSDKIPKKKIAELTDEAKEARGEAVRGPSKFISRLDSLAQPKRSYVHAHREEYQNRYGRNVMAERIQKHAIAGNSAAPGEMNASSPVSSKNRWRRHGAETAPVKQRAPSVPQLDKARGNRKRRSASSSPASASHRSPARHKHNPPRASPDSSVKNMVAVESYVQKQCRGTSRYNDRAGLRCRVPLLPQDLELASLTSFPKEEATSLGTTLHHMVQAFGTRRPSDALAALTECVESNRSNAPCSDSDRSVDIFEDNHLTTAVSALRRDSYTESLHKHPNSTSELENLETALYSHISGNFQKRLRIKNLTLTPKTSVQRIFLLQSGDAGTDLVKSVSNLKLNDCGTESLNELKAMPVLSNSHLDWTFAQIPMHITTVGYAFAQNQAHDATCPRIQFTREKLVQKAHSSQCFRGISLKRLVDTGAQVDEIATEPITMSMLPEAPLEILATKSNMLDGIKSIEICANKHISTILAVNEKECNDDSDGSTNKVVQESHNDANGDHEKSGEREKVSPGPSLAAAPDAVRYTTSLDMLVGLLNEIQNITCQNQMDARDHQNSDVDAIHFDMCNDREGDVSHDLISISSLDNLRQLESNGSIFTHIVSNVDAVSVKDTGTALELSEKDYRLRDSTVEFQSISHESVIKERDEEVGVSKPAGVDKEVSVNICESNVDTCTTPPSGIVPYSVNCGVGGEWSGTDVSVLKEPSTQSFLSVSEYHTLVSNTQFRTPSIKKIIELPRIETNERQALESRVKTDWKYECFISSSPAIRDKENVEKDRCLVSRGELGNYRVKTIDLDPMFKFKRDILVSVYSILVLTVFAALSFPGILVFQP